MEMEEREAGDRYGVGSESWCVTVGGVLRSVGSEKRGEYWCGELLKKLFGLGLI